MNFLGIEELIVFECCRTCDGLKVKGSAESLPARGPRGFQPRLAG